MAREDENRGFIRINCRADVRPLSNGSYRNHCPACLCSLHVDRKPGDRASDCRGILRPVGLAFRGGKGWQIVHRCERCGGRSVNRIAEDRLQPDDARAIARLSGRH